MLHSLNSEENKNQPEGQEGFKKKAAFYTGSDIELKVIREKAKQLYPNDADKVLNYVVTEANKLVRFSHYIN
jgi:hypothetical protein